MAFPKTAVLLEQPAIKPLYSAYIMDGGTASERIAIDWVEMVERTVKARCRFLTHTVSPTDQNRFHVSAQRGFEFITQVACVQVHYLNELPAKTVEMWLNDYSVTCVR